VVARHTVFAERASVPVRHWPWLLNQMFENVVGGLGEKKADQVENLEFV
jgi:hypothetical protein